LAKGLIHTLNNKPLREGDEKTLIVDFALEDARKLHKQQILKDLKKRNMEEKNGQNILKKELGKKFDKKNNFLNENNNDLNLDEKSNKKDKKDNKNNIKYGNSTLDWEMNLRKTSENKKGNSNFKIGNAFPIYATIVKDEDEKEVIRKPGFIECFNTIGSSINNTSTSLNEYMSLKNNKAYNAKTRKSNILISLTKTNSQNEKVSNFHKTTNTLWSKLKNTSRMNLTVTDRSILEKEENLNLLCLHGRALLNIEKELASGLCGKKYFVNMFMSSQYVKDRCVEEVFKFDY
jgi:hypothetical protein